MDTTIITVIRKFAGCTTYQLLQKAKYIILTIPLDMAYEGSEANNSDFKQEQNKNILRLVHH